MISFLRKFKDMVPETVQLVLLGVIVIYTIAFKVSYNVAFFNAIASLLSILLIVGASALLVFYKKPLAGYVVLLMALYFNGLTDFINALFSLQFSPFAYTPGFTPQLFINLIVFVYLFLLVLSYLFEGQYKARKVDSKTMIIGGMLFAFIWLIQGFYSAVILLLLPAIIALFGLLFPAMLLMLEVVIGEPFTFITNAINKSLGWRDLPYYFYLIGSLFFIYLLSVNIYKSIKEKTYNT